MPVMRYWDGTNWVDVLSAIASQVPISITSATTVTSGKSYLANGTFTVTVPVTSGTNATVKNTGSGSVTVVAASGLIDGGASAVLPQYASINVVADGTNVWIT